MKRCKYLGFGLLLTCYLGQAGCATLKITEVSSSRQGLERLRDKVAGRCKQMEQAMRDNDLMKVASFYTDHAILMS